MRPVIFCFTLSPPPSSATVMSATSAKEREARASCFHQRRVAPAFGGDEREDAEASDCGTARRDVRQR